MDKQYVVRLTDAQRSALQRQFDGALTRRQRNRVQVLLRSDAGDADAAIAAAVGIHINTVGRVRRRFAAEGLDAALTEKPRPGVPSKLDGKAEAVVVGLACSPTPDGHATWSARLLANRLVELEVVESVSEATVRRVLKKATSSRGKSGRGVSRRG